MNGEFEGKTTEALEDRENQEKESSRSRNTMVRT